MRKLYSTQEISQILECSIASVYSFERRGLITSAESSDQKYRGRKFDENQVNQLLTPKKEIDSAGKSFSDLAKTLKVSPGKIKKVVHSLEMDVEKVQTNIYSTRKRYALTSEQETEIIEYLAQQKISRPRVNYLYYTHMNLAWSQLFLIDEKLKVRLKQGTSGKLGFEINKDKFISFRKATQVHQVEAVYSIHLPYLERKQNNNFTDLIIPTEDDGFYTFLEYLYSICGVENFNAQLQNKKLYISIRNGDYLVTSKQRASIEDLFNKFIIQGNVIISMKYLSFTDSKKVR